jgi:protein tyrosine phosphatase (PTP) superfamily phosphohydrolase (DUF442 family)
MICLDRTTDGELLLSRTLATRSWGFTSIVCGNPTDENTIQPFASMDDRSESNKI